MRRWLPALVAAATLLAAAPALAGDFSSAEIVSAFNAERAAAGLGTVTENPDWSASCARHNHWMNVNGVIDHVELPGSPGYSDAGAWAGANSVLGPRGWADGDPWRTAPIHLSQMMSPLLAAVGAAESEGYNCLTTFVGYTEPNAEPATLAWFPGQRATLPADELAEEEPSTPGSWVGLPDGRVTGPYIFLYSPGRVGDPNPADFQCTFDAASDACVPGSQADPTPTVLAFDQVSGVSLVGPDGPVDVRTVDTRAAAAAGYADFMATIAMFIPAKPLRPGADYTLTATVSAAPAPDTAATDYAIYSAPGPMTATYSFRTARAGAGAKIVTRRGVTVTIPRRVRADDRISVLISGQRRFAARVVAQTRGHRALDVESCGRCRAGTQLSFDLRVPSRYRRSGSRVQVKVRVAVADRVFSVRGRVRFG